MTELVNYLRAQILLPGLAQAWLAGPAFALNQAFVHRLFGLDDPEAPVP